MNYKAKIKAITWNVRGLNERTKRLAIRETFFIEKPDLACLQETKLSVIDDRVRKEISGARLGKYEYLPARGTRGGMLVVWSERRFRHLTTRMGEYCLTVLLQDVMLDIPIQVTSVYSPTNSASRADFFREIEDLKPTNSTPWMVSGDFNTTLQAQDRNGSSQDWRWPLAFADLISAMGLQDIHMEGRRYTWSNYRNQPAMARLDRFLFSTDWSLQFPNTKQRSLPNTSSDHCPILIEALSTFLKSKIFRFETFWLELRGFKEMITQRWQSLPTAITPT